MSIWKWLTNATEGTGHVIMEPAKPPEKSGSEASRFVSEIRTRQTNESVPTFKRSYEAVLDHRATAKVTFKTSGYFGRTSTGFLTQPGGKYVFFDPEAIADRIIDPTLVSLVEAFVEEVKKMDRQFILENCSRFTDEKGVVWVRAAIGGE